MASRPRPGVAAAVTLVIWAAVAAAAGQSTNPAAARAGSHVGGASLLDVPYLPQTEDLCGGAALAMTLRVLG